MSHIQGIREQVDRSEKCWEMGQKKRNAMLQVGETVNDRRWHRRERGVRDTSQTEVNEKVT